MDLNQLARLSFDADDWNQFSQLTGYSVSGWSDLSYADPFHVLKAEDKARKLTQRDTKIIVVTALFVNDDNNILMAQRLNDAIYPGMWELPGGKVERGETNVEALIREIKEELGITISDDVVAVTNAKLYLDRSLELVLYHAFPAASETRTAIPLASQQLKWVDLTYAVNHLPCMPGTYIMYQKIKEFIDNLE